MMCAKFLRHTPEEKQGKLFRASERVFQRILDTYAHGLRWVLRHQPFMLGVTVATLCLSIYLYVIVPKGFFPQQDQGRLTGSVLGAQDTSFVAMQQKMRQLLDIIQSDPATKTVLSVTGGGAENTGQIRMDLVPLNQRKISSDQVIARLRRKVATVPGVSLFMQSSQDIKVGGRMSNSQFQYTLEGDNIDD